VKSYRFADIPEVRKVLKPTLILVRHGSTEMDGPGTQNKVQGWLPGGLDKKGVRESEAIARTLARFPIKRLYTSDLDRARETADIIADHIDMTNPITRRDLRCWFMGSYQGRIKDEKMREQIDKMQTDFPSVTIPKGESFNAFKHRFIPALRALLLEAGDAPSDGFIVAVVHSDTLRVAHAWVAAGSDGDALDADTLSAALESHVKPGEAAVLSPRKNWRSPVDGKWQISYLKGTDK
jgi:broad specificity phosphatase PhoE